MSGLLRVVAGRPSRRREAAPGAFERPLVGAARPIVRTAPLNRVSGHSRAPRLAAFCSGLRALRKRIAARDFGLCALFGAHEIWHRIAAKIGRWRGKRAARSRLDLARRNRALAEAPRQVRQIDDDAWIPRWQVDGWLFPSAIGETSGFRGRRAFMPSPSEWRPVTRPDDAPQTFARQEKA